LVVETPGKILMDEGSTVLFAGQKDLKAVPSRYRRGLAAIDRVDLRNAIDQGTLTLDYQPQFEVRSGRACGVEALARWPRWIGGAIAPSVFIPLAERTGLIGALGSWVLEEMLQDLGCLQVQGYLLARPASAETAKAILTRPWGMRAERSLKVS
jgi:EAL domain-containing protein (putative c-di-GMP-specific phosphodiesterase class I)